MKLIEAIDAQFAGAEAQAALPFRLELQEDEIDALREAGALEPRPGEHDSCRGIYRGLKVYPATQSLLMVQPEGTFKAVYLPLKS